MKQGKKNQETEEVKKFEVEAVLDHWPENTDSRSVKEYLIKWKGYDACDNTWENAVQVHSDVSEMVDEYWARKSKNL